jgi:acetyl-CoA carboxylase biotin carboxylase subunit
MQRALAEYSVAGIKTNLSFFRTLLTDASFRSGQLHTGFIEEFFEQRAGGADSNGELEDIAALMAALASASAMTAVEPPAAKDSRWKTLGRISQLR